VRRDSVSGGIGSGLVIPAITTPQVLPSTRIGVATVERSVLVAFTTSPIGPEAPS
jgi:hypothetical protein